MARIRPALGIDRISGPVGGITFAPNRNRHVVGVQVPTRRRTSPAQRDARSAFAEVAAGWSSLTETERQSWNTWAAAYDLGPNVDPRDKPSGHARYVAANRFRRSIGLPPLTTPTAPGRGNAEFPLVDLFADWEAGELRVGLLQAMPTGEPTPRRVAIYLTRPTRRSVTANPKDQRLVATFDPDNVDIVRPASPLVFPIPSGGVRGGRLWGLARSTNAAGYLSSPGLWNVDTVEPGESWALRLRNVASNVQRPSVQIAGGELIARGLVDGFGPFEERLNLRSSPWHTIGSLASNLLSLTPFAAIDVNPAYVDRPSIELIETTERTVGRTIQPRIFTVPA